MNQEIKTSPPGYGEIIQEIGKQLRSRKKDFLKRIILISWPVPTIFAIFKLKNYLSEINIINLSEQHNFLFLIIIGILAIVVIFYYYFLSAIFAIEKRVWIDSYFDNRNLDSKTSWKTAKKILPSAAMLTLMTFLRFYLSA